MLPFQFMSTRTRQTMESVKYISNGDIFERDQVLYFTSLYSFVSHTYYFSEGEVIMMCVTPVICGCLASILSSLTPQVVMIENEGHAPNPYLPLT